MPIVTSTSLLCGNQGLMQYGLCTGSKAIIFLTSGKVCKFGEMGAVELFHRHWCFCI